MGAEKPITIVGGGLAGLTLGIGLRQEGIPVTIWEADHYPRHRVCGEFVSGQGQAVLDRLGIRRLLLETGATLGHTAVFCLGGACSPLRSVTPPALCLSRFRMDAALAWHVSALGAQLQVGRRWDGPRVGEGFVFATGRRPHAVEQGWRWFGLKVHARGVDLAADLEMHGVGDGYVGVSRLDGTEVNVCGLFRRRAGTPGAARPGLELLRGDPGSSLHARLAGATFDEASFCAVAGLSLRPVRATGQPECRIGDALTMTPPVTGNGMSMAFEAAELAIQPLAAYSRGELSWYEAREAVARACDQQFTRRLAWAAWLQALMFAPALRGRLGGPVLGSHRLWRVLFDRTR